MGTLVPSNNKKQQLAQITLSKKIDDILRETPSIDHSDQYELVKKYIISESPKQPIGDTTATSKQLEHNSQQSQSTTTSTTATETDPATPYEYIRFATRRNATTHIVGQNYSNILSVFAPKSAHLTLKHYLHMHLNKLHTMQPYGLKTEPFNLPKINFPFGQGGPERKLPPFITVQYSEPLQQHNQYVDRSHIHPRQSILFDLHFSNSLHHGFIQAVVPNYDLMTHHHHCSHFVDLSNL
jgi:hypothetical protein